jgi:hypothetical protein
MHRGGDLLQHRLRTCIRPDVVDGAARRRRSCATARRVQEWTCLALRNASTDAGENPVASPVPASTSVAPNQRMPADLFAKEEVAPQHAEDRNQEGDRQRGRGADVGDQAEVEQVRDTAAEHAESNHRSDDAAARKGGRHRQEEQCRRQQQRRCPHAAVGVGEGVDGTGGLGIGRGDPVREGCQQGSGDGQAATRRQLGGLDPAEHGDTGNATGQPAQLPRRQRLAPPDGADRGGPDRRRRIQDRQQRRRNGLCRMGEQQERERRVEQPEDEIVPPVDAGSQRLPEAKGDEPEKDRRQRNAQEDERRRADRRRPDAHEQEGGAQMAESTRRRIRLESFMAPSPPRKGRDA